MNQKPFSERILQLIDRHKSVAGLARKSGISESAIKKWRDGKSDPSREKLVILAKTAEVDLVWLATGERAIEPVGHKPTPSDKTDIPILDVEVSAGHGAENGHETSMGSLAFQRQYLASRGLTAKELRVVYAKGDSMEPEIQDGAAMLINTVDTRLDEGCIYVIRYDDHLFAKRVRRWLGGISLVSANELYPPINVEPEQLQEMRVMGRVVWSGREH